MKYIIYEGKNYIIRKKKDLKTQKKKEKSNVQKMKLQWSMTVGIILPTVCAIY